MATLQQVSPPTLSTGIPGLDEILNGGLTPNRMYLVEGEPGVGKTTFALQYLIEGARRGEPVLIVSCRNHSRSCARSLHRTAGRSMAFTCAS